MTQVILSSYKFCSHESVVRLLRMFRFPKMSDSVCSTSFPNILLERRRFVSHCLLKINRCLWKKQLCFNL